MNIAICGLIDSKNLGERFIAESLDYLIKSQNKDNKIHTYFVDIIPPQFCQPARRDFILVRFLYALFSKIPRHLHFLFFKNIFYILEHFIFIHTQEHRKKLDFYFNEKFSNVDVIVIDGAGLLEYSFNEYQEYLLAIVEFANLHCLPVVFNAIGRAGEFNKKDYRCKILMKCFQYPCVKYVSARDSVENVQECVGDRFKVKLLADAAFCIKDVYQPQCVKTSIIGIGLIRSNAFNTYENGLNDEQVVELFVDIAKELEKNGFRYQFFTNGFENDYIVGKKVIKKLGVDESCLVNRPTSWIELLETINSYSGLITCRMHSSIAAFSYGIPSIALSWNKKIDKYMERIGYPERAISINKLNKEYIVSQLKIALRDGISAEIIDKMEKYARESVSDYAYLFEEVK